MKLGFDLDDVVVDLLGIIKKYLNKTYNIEFIDFEKHDIFENTYHPDEELSKKIAINLLEKVNDASFLSKAKPYKDAVVCIKKLKKAGHTIHYVTARNISAEYKTAVWLRKHHVPFDTIHNVGRQGEKGMIGRMLNLDFYMDDVEKHLESMIKYKKRWRKGLVLFTQTWNSKSIDASKFIRLDNWTQVSRHLGIHKR